MIPKVAGYSGFDSYGITPYSALKPGQTKLDRDYYKDANRTKPDGKTYLSTFSRFGSNHQGTIDQAVKPSDFKSTNREGKKNLKYEYLHDPHLFNYTKQGRRSMVDQKCTNQPRASTELSRAACNNMTGTQGNAGEGQNLYKTTSHWTSNYQGENAKTQARPSSQAQRAFWSYPKRAHVARRTFFKTEYLKTVGTDEIKLTKESTKLENVVNELTMGTTKVTSHIPGYGGYLVKTDLNEKALHHGKNQYGRDLMKAKVNVNDNFNVKIPGYSGYKPLSCVNDRGTVRPKLFSTEGETFF